MVYQANLLHATADEPSLLAGKRHRCLASRSLEKSSCCQVRGLGNIPSRLLKLYFTYRLQINSYDPDSDFFDFCLERYIKAFDPAVLAAMKSVQASLDMLNDCSATVQQVN
jgi:hypothetical protein